MIQKGGLRRAGVSQPSPLKLSSVVSRFCLQVF